MNKPGFLSPTPGIPVLRCRPSARLILILVAVMGISHLTTQLTVLRELLAVLAGNEFTIGIIMASWFLTGGLGAGLGRFVPYLRRQRTWLIVLLLIFAFLPYAHLIAVRGLRNIIFLPGTILTPTATLISALILLAPYGLISGFLLVLATALVSDSDQPHHVGQIYLMDNIGDILGGLFFTLLLVVWGDHFRLLLVPFSAVLLTAALIAWEGRERVLQIILILVMELALALVLAVNFDAWTLHLLHREQKIVSHTESPYGRLVAAESGGELSFFENGKLLFNINDPIAREELIHPVMAQRKTLQQALLISGGVNGSAAEILKYPLRRLDYVELDPAILEAGRKYTPFLRDARLRLITGDGRRYLERSIEKYDAIMIGLPDPENLELNRYYTQEFFAAARRALTSQGVLGLSLAAGANYLSEPQVKMHSLVFAALKKNFAYVEILPLNRFVYLASNQPLELDIAALIKKRGIATEYMRGYYLNGLLTPERLNWARKNVGRASPINSDFNPDTVFYSFKTWYAQFERQGWGLYVGITVLALILLYLWRGGGVLTVIFATGFYAASLEIILLLFFQIFFGYLYIRLGLLISLFIMGLALGSGLVNRKLQRIEAPKRALGLMELTLTLFSLALPLLLQGLPLILASGWDWMGESLLAGLCLICGCLTGAEFPLAVKADFKGSEKTSSRLYFADLVGGALGALLISAWLVPGLGLANSCFLLAAIKFLSLLNLRR